jgi:acyl-CoA thioesterase
VNSAVPIPVTVTEAEAETEAVLFDRDLALTEELLPDSPSGSHVRRFAGTFSDRWFIDRALHGGHVIAAMVRAVEAAVEDPARPIRSLTNHYLLPAKAGSFHIDVTIERSGRTLTNVSARLVQQGQTVALALAAHGGPWESYDWDHTAMPQVPAPQDCPDLWEGTGGFTNLHKNWQYKLAMGPAMGSGKITDRARTESVSGGWVRLAEPRPVDSAVAAALTDTWVPMPFTYIDESHPIMFPTIELTVHFLDPLPLAGDTGIDPCLVWHRIDTSRSGFVVQDTEVWTRSGRLIARGRQNALLIPVTR